MEIKTKNMLMVYLWVRDGQWEVPGSAECRAPSALVPIAPWHWD